MVFADEVGAGLARVRDREAAAALVEQHDAVALGVEQAAVRGLVPAPGPPCRNTTGLPSRLPRHLPVDVLSVAHVEHARLERLDLRIQVSHDLTVTTSGCRERMPRRAAARSVSGPPPALRIATYPRGMRPVPDRPDPARSPSGLPPSAARGARRRTRDDRPRRRARRRHARRRAGARTSHPPVYYLPIAAFRPDALVAANGSSFCEFKGAARYLSLRGGGTWPNAPPGTTRRRRRGSSRSPTVSPCTRAEMDECTVDGEQVVPQPGRFYGGWITSNVVGPFKGGAGSLGW